MTALVLSIALPAAASAHSSVTVSPAGVITVTGSSHPQEVIVSTSAPGVYIQDLTGLDSVDPRCDPADSSFGDIHTTCHPDGGDPGFFTSVVVNALGGNDVVITQMEAQSWSPRRSTAATGTTR